MAKEKEGEFGKATNDRGFLGYGEFEDSHGQKVRLVESSADPLVYAHLFVGDGGCIKNAEYEDGRKFGRAFLQPSPHLNVRQAMKLIAMLTKFVEHKLATSHDEPLTEE
jgi:hypothetical protein